MNKTYSYDKFKSAEIKFYKKFGQRKCILICSPSFYLQLVEEAYKHFRIVSIDYKIYTYIDNVRIYIKKDMNICDFILTDKNNFEENYINERLVKINAE